MKEISRNGDFVQCESRSMHHLFETSYLKVASKYMTSSKNGFVEPNRKVFLKMAIGSIAITDYDRSLGKGLIALTTNRWRHIFETLSDILTCNSH